MDTHANLIKQFNALPENWNAWLIENIQRGCAPEELAQILLREGLIDPTKTSMHSNQQAQEHLSWLEEIVEQKNRSNPAQDLTQEQKTWLAQALFEQKTKEQIYQTLKAQGLNEIDIANELVHLKQNPILKLLNNSIFITETKLVIGYLRSFCSFKHCLQ
jgi:2-succinyl-5-enolpyruvyl-6-hydroxy-3-cyclohexene-1-carboxylate synthase